LLVTYKLGHNLNFYSRDIFQWIKNEGITIVSFVVETIEFDKE